MFRKTHYLMVGWYVIATMVLLSFRQKPSKNTKDEFLLLGLVGQVLLFQISYDIYKSQQIWQSFSLYGLMYVIYIISFTCIDMYLYLKNSINFTGRIYKEVDKMFLDFVYLNFCTVSTMGYSNITPNTTITRTYSSYKIAVSIFMIVFLVSDINVKTK